MRKFLFNLSISILLTVGNFRPAHSAVIAVTHPGSMPVFKWIFGIAGVSLTVQCITDLANFGNGELCGDNRPKSWNDDHAGIGWLALIVGAIVLDANDQIATSRITSEQANKIGLTSFELTGYNDNLPELESLIQNAANYILEKKITNENQIPEILYQLVHDNSEFDPNVINTFLKIRTYNKSVLNSY